MNHRQGRVERILKSIRARNRNEMEISELRQQERWREKVGGKYGHGRWWWGGLQEIRPSRRACLCLQSIIAAGRWEEEGFFSSSLTCCSQRPSQLPGMDVFISPSAIGRASAPAPSAVGEATRTCRHACVYACLCKCVCVCM